MIVCMHCAHVHPRRGMLRHPAPAVLVHLSLQGSAALPGWYSGIAFAAQQNTKIAALNFIRLSTNYITRTPQQPIRLASYITHISYTTLTTVYTRNNWNRHAIMAFDGHPGACRAHMPRARRTHVRKPHCRLSHPIVYPVEQGRFIHTCPRCSRSRHRPHRRVHLHLHPPVAPRSATCPLVWHSVGLLFLYGATRSSFSSFPFACCVGSLLSVGCCGLCSCWCPPPPPQPSDRGRMAGLQRHERQVALVLAEAVAHVPHVHLHEVQCPGTSQSHHPSRTARGAHIGLDARHCCPSALTTPPHVTAFSHDGAITHNSHTAALPRHVHASFPGPWLLGVIGNAACPHSHCILLFLFDQGGCSQPDPEGCSTVSGAVEGGGVPLCDIPSGCCFLTGPWTVTRSSLRMLRRVAAFCWPLRPVLLLVSFPRSRSPVVGVLGLC